MRATLTLAALLFVGAAPAAAQAERYELGRRLKRFEAEWDKQPDPAARKRALEVLPKAATRFLAFQLGEAARALDDATFALRSADPPSDAERWAASLYLDPGPRLVDSAAGRPLAVRVRSLYPVKGGRPKATVKVVPPAGDAVTAPLDDLPAEVAVPVSAAWPADGFLFWEVTADGSPVGKGVVRVSARPDLPARAVDWKTLRKALPPGDDLEAATLRDRLDLLLGLADGDVPETDLPAGRLADEAGTLAAFALAKQPYFAADRPGDFRVTVPTGGKARTPCRVFVPKGLDPAKPVPVVVGLHGAGGSENLFFEGYGSGYAVAACEKRGWVFVATRSGAGFLGGPPPVAAVLDKLAERYPIDKGKAFLVGHSMGASHAVEAVQQSPGRFAAVAYLGGSGRVRAADPFAGLPAFVGVGTKDFALTGSRTLNTDLSAKGAKVTFKEYPDLDHLIVVREALPDVFALFDEAAKAR